jgi:ABC-type nitrate/sulfonate/bicarbonate transport system substrate-binding protein
MTPLMALTTCDYDSTMGVGVLDDSPILKPQDLVGKRVASVPTSANYVETTDPVMRYLTAGSQADPEAIFTNRFAGKIKLGTSEWNDVRARLSEFDKYLS